MNEHVAPLAVGALADAVSYKLFKRIDGDTSQLVAAQKSLSATKPHTKI